MGNDDRWYFTKDQLENSPSRQCGIDSLQELTYRQQAANFIRDMGHNLKVSQLCVNTAIVYMHRFYVFHSFTHFPWHSIAAAALFLAAKVEEQPRKVEYVVKVAFMCKNHKELNCDANHQDKYQQLSQDLVFNENVLLQTLGFDVAIDHPHTHIVRCCHLVKAGKDLAHTSYFMASNSLHLTTMCLQYKPTVVACFCIHLACKWSQWEIPLSNEKKEWFSYVDPTVTAELLQQLTEEFLVVFDQCPSRLREKALAICGNRPTQQQQPQSGSSSSQQQQVDGGGDLKKVDHNPSKGSHAHRQSHHGEGKAGVFDDPHKHRRPHEHGSSSSMQQQQQLQQRDRDREYREKKERERLAAQQHGAKMPGMPGQHPSNKQPVPHHHRSSSDSSKHPRLPMPVPSSRQEPRDILREATKDIGLRDYRDPKRELTKESVSRDLNREHQQIRSSGSSSNSSNSASSSDKVMNNYPLNYDKQRMHVDPNKVPPKHEQVRRHDDIYLKNENEIKKHLSASVRDKNASGSGYIGRSVPPQQQQQQQQSLQQQQQQQQQQQKLKSPFITDPSKSVLKPNVMIKQEQSSYSASNYHPPVTEIKQEVLPQLPVKKPSLFSPEKSPPPKKFIPKKIESVNSTSSSGISSMSSPLDTTQRFRTSSSGSEPELRPVIQKIEQQQGFEMLLKDPSAGIKLEQVPDVVNIKEEKPESSYSKDMKPPDVILPFNSATPLVNGIETNPTLISNLLKEAPSVPHLPAVAATTAQPTESKEKDKTHGHKEHKKKNKEKHKHKDKDKSKEEKEKKKKHKDKDREKHKHRDKHHEGEIQDQPMVAEPIKLTIQKDRIQPVENSNPAGSLKIKIPKDKIKTEAPRTELKIKIPKEVITGGLYSGETSGSSSSSSSKKRERDRSSPNGGGVGAPPSKMSRSSSSSKYSSEPKQNGRHSHGKVAQLGDGEQSQHRLAESKYIKNSS